MSGYVIGVHKSPPNFFSDKWIEFLDKHGATVKELDLMRPDALNQCAECDAVMWHWCHEPYEQRYQAHPVLESLERYQDKVVFPNSMTAWHFDDKVAQSYLFDALKIPTPNWWVFSYETRDDALLWAETAPLPLVRKASFGAGSNQVSLIKTRDELRELLEHSLVPGGKGSYFRPCAYQDFFRTDVKGPHRLLSWMRYRFTYYRKHFQLLSNMTELAYLQVFIPQNDYDIRVTVIGDRAFVFRRHNRPDDFRASGSGMIDHEHFDDEKAVAHFAHEMALRMHSQSAAFDILRTDEGYKILEVSYGYLDTAVHDCSGYWKRTGEWVEGHMWPQEAHVLDVLEALDKKKGCRG